MPIEEQLLPSKKLKPYYDKVVWLYVCRTFKDTPKDREALRTHDRFGISSWPQQFVFDPRDDRVLTNMPRKLEPFIASLDKVLKGWRAPAGSPRLHVALGAARAAYKKGDRQKAIAAIEPLAKKKDKYEGWLEARELLRTWRPGTDRRKPAARLADPDPRERAIALEELQPQPDHVRPVTRLLTGQDEDIVVRIRALRYLRKVAPKSVTNVAGKLLGVGNDPFRYEVLTVIQEHPDPALEATLVRLFQGAGSKDYPSRNPNVLRIRTAQCLGVCGGTAAIDVLAKPARESNPNNGLTRIVFASLAAIGSRVGKAGQKEITHILIDSLPRPCGMAKSTLRRHLYLVQEILKGIGQVTGRKQLPAAPSVWSAKERDKFQKQLRRLFR